MVNGGGNGTTADGTTAMPPALVDARQSLGPAMLDDLFPEGEAFARSLQTFVVLLALAAFIAAFGLYQDSVASIIGAMVVAPLGGAIMAFAGALVTGRSRWQAIAFLQVALGALGVIGIGYVVSLVMPDPLVLTPSLQARTSPGILDLGVALTAGAAGAYVAARRTGNDALPGVAIAVSLVPPLATVGICLEMGRTGDAAGALLLFLTNFAAIVVVACIVFVLSGATPSREMLRERHRLHSGFIVALVALVAITIPLAWNTADVLQGTIRSAAGAPFVRAWIGDRDLEVTGWTIDDDRVEIRVLGTEAPADAAPLAAELAKAFAAPVDLRIVYTPVVRSGATGAP
ncbi:MAG TPA: DUF389 domain-containing protein [Candidatus Limnocylindrales bacterium]|nr:DUF389 domain-containing protein [Candidatus Limnocylindrales bacterium]